MHDVIEQIDVRIPPVSDKKLDLTGTFVRCIRCTRPMFKLRLSEADTWKLFTIGMEFRTDSMFKSLWLRNIEHEELDVSLLYGTGQVRDDRLHVMPQSPQQFVYFAQVPYTVISNVFVLAKRGNNSSSITLEPNPARPFFKLAININTATCCIAAYMNDQLTRYLFGGDTFEVYSRVPVVLTNLSYYPVTIRTEFWYYPEGVT